MPTTSDPMVILQQILEKCPSERLFVTPSLMLSEFSSNIVLDNFITVLNGELDKRGWTWLEINPCSNGKMPMEPIISLLRTILFVDDVTLEQNANSPPERRMLQFGHYLLPPFFMDMKNVTELFRVIGDLASPKEIDEIFDTFIEGISNRKRIIFSTILQILEWVAEQSPQTVGFFIILHNFCNFDLDSLLWLQFFLNEKHNTPLVFWAKHPDPLESCSSFMQKFVTTPNPQLMILRQNKQEINKNPVTQSFSPSIPEDLKKFLPKPIAEIQSSEIQPPTPSSINSKKFIPRLIAQPSPDENTNSQKSIEIIKGDEQKKIILKAIDGDAKKVEHIELKGIDLVASLTGEKKSENLIPVLTENNVNTISKTEIPTEEACHLAAESKILFDKLFAQK